MNLKNIPLPAIVLANLYKGLLVEPHIKKAQVQSVAGVNFFGGNSRHILLLVNNPDTFFLTDNDLKFLTDVLTACKLSMNDIAIVNIVKTPAVMPKHLPEILQAEIIIAAGLENSVLELPFKIPAFQIQLYQNKKYVFIPSVNNIKGDTLFKKKLWEALKTLFSI